MARLDARSAGLPSRARSASREKWWGSVSVLAAWVHPATCQHPTSPQKKGSSWHIRTLRSNNAEEATWIESMLNT